MTELETHLFNALKTLQAEFGQQYKASQIAQESLEKMFKHISENMLELEAQNRRLASQVMNLSDQVQRLNKALQN